MNSKNGKTSDPNRLVLILQIKKIYRGAINILSYHILVSIKREEIKKSSYKNSKLEILTLTGIISSIYLVDHILYQILKIILIKL